MGAQRPPMYTANGRGVRVCIYFCLTICNLNKVLPVGAEWAQFPELAAGGSTARGPRRQTPGASQHTVLSPPVLTHGWQMLLGRWV